ncbi:hypothetical protein E3E12_02305 [Formicincola oecophyllae]|uniref:Uncharacterized protein n=1 Tax=Formicincola oecophyllae TaxID=2558361 RepID=A0A4Y6U762_9PROT|nr:hypothetical protein [Formicincola oecophyllae]QDH13223.2 hypothetical protein E3E12_02305 [Formicincola oecophyllae]
MNDVRTSNPKHRRSATLLVATTCALLSALPAPCLADISLPMPHHGPVTTPTGALAPNHTVSFMAVVAPLSAEVEKKLGDKARADKTAVAGLPSYLARENPHFSKLPAIMQAALIYAMTSAVYAHSAHPALSKQKLAQLDKGMGVVMDVASGKTKAASLGKNQGLLVKDFMRSWKNALKVAQRASGGPGAPAQKSAAFSEQGQRLALFAVGVSGLVLESRLFMPPTEQAAYQEALMENLPFKPNP